MVKPIELYYDGKRLSTYSKEEIMEFFIETSEALVKAKVELRENARKDMGMKPNSSKLINTPTGKHDAKAKHTFPNE